MHIVLESHDQSFQNSIFYFQPMNDFLKDYLYLLSW
jgi:hypothetical protein